MLPLSARGNTAIPPTNVNLLHYYSENPPSALSLTATFVAQTLDLRRAQANANDRLSRVEPEALRVVSQTAGRRACLLGSICA